MITRDPYEHVHRYTARLIRVLRDAETCMGAAWQLKCVTRALRAMYLHYEGTGNYTRAEQFAAAVRALQALQTEYDGSNEDGTTES